MLNRRRFLKQTAGFAVAGLAIPEAVRAADIPDIQAASMRSSINATDLGARPGALDDQSRIFSAMLEKAGNQDMPVFLPPGTYVVSNVTLPRHLRAIIGHRWAKPATGDLASLEKSGFANLTVERNHVS